MEGEKSPKFPISTEHPLSINSHMWSKLICYFSPNKAPLNNSEYELPELHVQRKYDVLFLRNSSHMLYVHML